MFRIIFQIALMFFAAYGITVMGFSMMRFLENRKITDRGVIWPVLLVKDCEEVIEGVVRDIARSSILSGMWFNRPVKIIDIGSEDETLEILYKLRRMYDFIEVKSADDELKHIIEDKL